MLFIFSTPVLIIHLWQLKTVVFLHWFLIRAVLSNYILTLLQFQHRDLQNNDTKHNNTKINSTKDSNAFQNCLICDTQ